MKPRAPVANSPASAAASLHVEHLKVTYNRSTVAVRDLSFTVKSGHIVSLIGLNGAGKTSTLRAISGFLPVERADVQAERMEIDGVDLRGKRPDQTTRMGVGLVPERNKIFAELTVQDNLRMGLSSRRPSPEVERIRQLVSDTFPGLNARMSQKAGFMSGGERQQLAIATALLRAPRVLLVDEMSLGLAPSVVESLVAALKQISSELGLTVVVVEQSAHVAVALSSYLYVLEDGLVVAEGPTSAMNDAEDLAARYLGVEVR